MDASRHSPVRAARSKASKLAAGLPVETSTGISAATPAGPLHMPATTPATPAPPPASLTLPATAGEPGAELLVRAHFDAFLPYLDYLKPEERLQVEEAFVFAARAHHGQLRNSGEPYITHPLAVARQVAEWRLDVQAVMAAVLHDVLEDSGCGKECLEQEFGAQVADLVDGLSKLDKIEFQTYVEAQAENFRKMLLAMSRDLRVILIKLADRQHNMQTLGAMRPDKRRRIARETIEIYAPIANRLGLNKLCRELQDMAFGHMHPMRYRVLAKAVNVARGNRRELLQRIHDSVIDKLKDAGLDAELQGREKTVFSIYRKMIEKRLTFSQVLDIFGFRVVVADVPSCYLALGALHSLFKPIPGKFKDYIAIPKANGYQSLHTTLIGPYGAPLEVQIRSREMHQVAQDGVASHWLYKTSEESTADLQYKTHKWLQSLLELQQGSGDSKEFLEHVKVDLFPDEVYVFTPKGKIMELPRGATPVDFAYAVHTDVGHRCVAAKINHVLVPLRTELSNGDRVEIIVAAHASPNPAWLGYVKTGRARSKIRQFLKTRQHDESVRLGERFLDQALRAFGANLAALAENTWERFLKEIGGRSKGDILSDLGLGKRNAGLDARRLLVLGHFDVPDDREHLPLPVTGEEGAALQFATCCRPIPGDPVVGIVSQGHGIVVHTHDCPQLRRNRGDRDRWIDVEWDVAPDRLFDVVVRVQVKNARGVLAKVATAISEAASNIENVSMDEKKADAVTTLQFTLQVHNRVHLAQVMRNIRQVPAVLRIQRAKGEN